MRFLRRHQYLLCVVAVLVLASVMVLSQYRANHSAHVQLREDFILLDAEHRPRAAEQLYQVLIQQLPGLSEQALVEDLERTAMLVNPAQPDSESLVWKYYVSVQNELRKRAAHRLAGALRRAREQ